jgi:hypothetical protein
MKRPESDEQRLETTSVDLAERKSETAPADPTGVELMKELALGGGLQALWAAVLPMVGVRSARANEFPGVFQVEPGPTPNEALVHVDIPSERYESGKKPRMDRVVSLSVKLAHDFRRLGDRYYCVDCETPNDETRH